MVSNSLIIIGYSKSLNLDSMTKYDVHSMKLPSIMVYGITFPPEKSQPMVPDFKELVMNMENCNEVM